MKKFFQFSFFLLSFTLAAQESETYFESYDQSEPYPFIVESSSEENTECDGPRQDIYDLTQANRELLSGLIMQYLTSNINPLYNPNNPDQRLAHPSLKYDVIAFHSANGDLTQMATWHDGTEYFLSWHRDYLQGLEQWLLDRGHPEFVPLPGWDPSTALPTEYNNLIIPDVLANPYPKTDGTFHDMTMNTITAGQLQMYTVDDMTCDQFDNIDDFARFIMGQGNNDFDGHFKVHGALGGAMGFGQTAPAAAIFWPFHAFVDDIYHCYQTRCQNCTPAFIRLAKTQKECTLCFDAETYSADVDNIDLKFFKADGTTQIFPELDSDGCITEAWREANLNPGEKIKLQVTGSNDCSTDEVELEYNMPMNYKVSGSGTKTQYTNCGQITIHDRISPSPFWGTGVTIELTNLGEAGETSVWHHDLQNGSTELLLDEIILQEEEVYSFSPNTSNWTIGNHAIEIRFGAEIQTSIVTKF